ncbi:hypothetical protein EYF80_042086 [Liparis tanakae]|uniref:Uncharacterized protein n=1 Tax=Liparis tanakae TaxID=230148 RepID=A0A4Z2G2C4_9TELE|nr:hypothetical protein EYF80_042086 [Liparis tanakae]
MTDGILFVLISSHFDCVDPSIPPRGPYVLHSEEEEEGCSEEAMETRQLPSSVNRAFCLRLRGAQTRREVTGVHRRRCASARRPRPQVSLTLRDKPLPLLP